MLDRDLRSIAARAATLDERMQGVIKPDPSLPNAAERLAAWQKWFDKDAFHSHLTDFYSKTKMEALPCLADGQWQGNLPEWVTILTEVESMVGIAPLIEYCNCPSDEIAAVLTEQLISFLTVVAPHYFTMTMGQIAQEWPVVARCICSLLLDVKSFFLIFHQRLQKDFPSLTPQLIQTTRNSLPPCTLKVTTAHKTLYYKPRSLDLDIIHFATWSQLLEAMGLSSIPTVTLSRHNYGWMEEIKTETCAPQILWKTLGAMIAFTYFFNIFDLKTDNFLITKNGVMPIDLEALWRPQRDAHAAHLMQNKRDRLFNSSILFPRLVDDQTTHSLFSTLIKEYPFDQKTLENGFCTAYRILSQKKDSQQFSGGFARCFLRSQSVFVELITQRYRIENLKDNFTFSAPLQGLYQHLVNPASVNEKQLVHFEVAAMSRLAIPQLYHHTEHTHLYDADRRCIIENFFKEPAAISLQENFTSASRKDFFKQLLWIKRATALYTSNKPPSAPKNALEAASQIAHVFHKELYLENGIAWGFSTTWNPHAPEEILTYQPLDETLESGLSGILLFLSAWYKVSGCRRSKELAQGIIRALLLAPLQSAIQFHWMSGLCGVIHALLVSGTLLKDQEAINGAYTLSHALYSENPLPTPSLFYGYSGTLGIATMLFEFFGDKKLLERALTLSHAITIPSPALELSGAATGYDGMLLALQKLSKHTQEPDLHEKIQQIKKGLPKTYQDPQRYYHGTLLRRYLEKPLDPPTPTFFDAKNGCCCGPFALLELWGPRLKNFNWHTHAFLHPRPLRFAPFSFTHGIAGIGYALLRAQDKALPSILALTTPY